MPQDVIPKVFNQYEIADSRVHSIMRGQIVNFSLDVLYAQYCSSQFKNNKNAHNPYEWKKSEHTNWE